MKQDFKIGLLVGLAVLIVIAVGWVLLRGRPAPRAASGRVPTPTTLRTQEPNRPVTTNVLGTGLQPYAAAPSATGGVQTTSPVTGTESNVTAGQPLAGTAPSTLTPASPAPAMPQTQPAAAQVRPAETAKPARTHTVLEGESLSDLADKYYGSSEKWNKIYRANRSTIKDPNKIYPGMKLTIPD
jgi:nucleoid-associated protein YgaU